MKQCYTCKHTKPLFDFGVNKAKPDGLNHECKPCVRVRSRAQTAKNPEAAKAKTRRYLEKNRELVLAKMRKRAEANSGARRKAAKEWRANNPHRNAASQALYRAKLKNRTPAWAEELTHLVQMEAFALAVLRKEATGIDWHVDHIIPLQGRAVSGLHVWNNLQLLPKHYNLRKSNRF